MQLFIETVVWIHALYVEQIKILRVLSGMSIGKNGKNTAECAIRQRDIVHNYRTTILNRPCGLRL